jgi:hypothetical protein
MLAAPIPVPQPQLHHALPLRQPAPRRCRLPLTPARAEQLLPRFPPPGYSPNMTVITTTSGAHPVPRTRFGRQGFRHLCSVAETPFRTRCVVMIRGNEDVQLETSACQERAPVALPLQPPPAAATAPARCPLSVPPPVPPSAAAAGHPHGPPLQTLATRPHPWQHCCLLLPPLTLTPAAAAALPPACSPGINSFSTAISHTAHLS